jgi:hypothetical protein
VIDGQKKVAAEGVLCPRCPSVRETRGGVDPQSGNLQGPVRRSQLAPAPIAGVGHWRRAAPRKLLCHSHAYGTAPHTPHTAQGIRMREHRNTGPRDALEGFWGL